MQIEINRISLISLCAYGRLKLREIDLFAQIHISFDVENLTDPWNIGYMRGRKERIDADLPYIDFDWDSLVGYLDPD